MKMQEAPYTLGLGSQGAHNTFRPLILKICNSTFLPATDADLVTEEVLFECAHKMTKSRLSHFVLQHPLTHRA